MKHTIILASILLLFASCRHDSQPQNQQTGNTLQLVKSFPLSRISTLQLYRSADTDNYITLQLVDDDGKISEIMGMGNADFDSDSIVLHPLLLADSLPAYALYTFDRTSTYGSTTCYLVHPYMKDFPDQFWTLFRIPFDILNIADAAIPKSSAIPTPATPTAQSSPTATGSLPPSRFPNKTSLPR